MLTCPRIISMVIGNLPLKPIQPTQIVFRQRLGSVFHLRDQLIDSLPDVSLGEPRSNTY